MFFLSRIMQVELCKRHVKGQKRQSSWWTGTASALRSMPPSLGPQGRETENIDQTQKKAADIAHGKAQTNAICKQEEGLTSHADTWRASYRQLAPPPLLMD